MFELHNVSFFFGQVHRIKVEQNMKYIERVDAIN